MAYRYLSIWGKDEKRRRIRLSSREVRFSSSLAGWDRARKRWPGQLNFRHTGADS